MTYFQTTRFVAFAVVLLSTVYPFTARMQQRRTDQPLPDDLYNLYEVRRERIRKAIAESQHEWAGTYLAGDHHPTVFTWTPQEGFLVTSSLHTFAPSWINYGKVNIDGPILTIYPELPKDNSSAHLMPTEFRLVRWDKQHYLIPPSDLKSFAFAVHSGAESEIVQYFVLGEDQNERRRGLPNLPAKYLEYMKMPAIVARIVSVGPEDGFSQAVTIAAGRRHRVAEGMMFYFSSRNGAQFSIRVREVSDRSSRGEVWLRATTGNARDVRVRVGLRVTSKIPRDFIQPG